MNQFSLTVRRSDKEETELRVALISGDWSRWLLAEGDRQLGRQRLKALGVLDQAHNAMDRVTNELAQHYGSPMPAVGTLTERLAGYLGDANAVVTVARYAQMDMRPMPATMASALHENERFTLAANECMVFVEWSGEKLKLRVVTPNRIEGEQDQENPGQPIYMEEELERVLDGKWVPVTDIWNIRDPANPSYRVMHEGNDVTGKIFTDDEGNPRTFEGDDYWWRWTQGARAGDPVIPGQLYHKFYHNHLFAPRRGAELACGTLQMGVGWSYWWHLVKDASYPQRVIHDGTIGGVVTAEDGTRGQANDPVTVLGIVRDNPEIAASIDQWGAASDPEALFRSLRDYEANLDNRVIPLDYSSTGGDPVAARQDARRRAVESQNNNLRASDARLLELCAMTVNNVFSLEGEQGIEPESGYSLLYLDEVDDGLSAVEKGPPKTITPEQSDLIVTVSTSISKGEMTPESGATLLSVSIPTLTEEQIREITTPPPTPTTSEEG